MQENLRLVIWTVVGVAALWFVLMTANRNLFLHSDIDRSFYGTIPVSQTDIGDQCGTEYRNSFEPVEYKMNGENQVVYLCPQGLWPIQHTVTAAAIPDIFRKRLPPALAKKLDILYPPQSAANNSMSTATPQQAAPPPAIANPFAPAEEQGTATPPPAAAAPQQQEQAAPPANQPAAQPLSPSVSQPMAEPLNQPANPPAGQPLNQPANQPASQNAQQPTAGPNPFIKQEPGTPPAQQAAPSAAAGTPSQ